MKSYHDYGAFTPIQVAAIAALEGPQDCVEEVRRNYQRRRDVLARGLIEAGWQVDVPKASMYIWAEIPEPYRAMGSLEFAKKLLNDTEDSPLSIAIELEGHCYSRLRSSNDFREGVEAFHDKRRARFNGT